MNPVPTGSGSATLASREDFSSETDSGRTKTSMVYTSVELLNIKYWRIVVKIHENASIKERKL
jgi:hypothetical protein